MNFPFVWLNVIATVRENERENCSLAGRQFDFFPLVQPRLSVFPDYDNLLSFQEGRGHKTEESPKAPQLDTGTQG